MDERTREEGNFTPPYIHTGLYESEELASRPDMDAHVQDYYSLELASYAVGDELTGELCYSGTEWVISKGPFIQIPIRHLPTFPVFTEGYPLAQ
jgi:hypothetical protein